MPLFTSVYPGFVYLVVRLLEQNELDTGRVQAKAIHSSVCVCACMYELPDVHTNTGVLCTHIHMPSCTGADLAFS